VIEILDEGLTVTAYRGRRRTGFAWVNSDGHWCVRFDGVAATRHVENKKAAITAMRDTNDPFTAAS
jgi:hypothetical protein